MNFPDASRFTGHHDVVLVGYRGVDGSSRLDCPEVASAREYARDYLTEESFRADAAAFKACAHRFQQDGVDLAGYTLPERVDDLDAARRALGYQRIDLLSESAGTRTALIYAWRYPARILRSARRTRPARAARRISRPRSTRHTSTFRGASGSCRSRRASSRRRRSGV
jgi:pimeloyl-ACP methyl ester carboxylesterase